MSKHTYFRLGGPADVYTTVRSSAELVFAIKEADKLGIPHFVLGAGSNILVGDRGIRGLVVKNEAKQAIWSDTGVTAESGIPMSELAAAAIARGLGGVEVFMSLPGTLGGALYNNSHYRPEKNEFIGNVVNRCSIMLDGRIISVPGSWFRFRYDYSRLQDAPAVVIKVSLSLTPAHPDELRKKALRLLKRRNARQPIGEACSGCVFKNANGLAAAKLIDKAGLKGARVGGAVVSPKHANFIINDGSASVADVIKLINQVRQTVKFKTRVMLHPEVFFVGEFSPQSRLILSSWQA